MRRRYPHLLAVMAVAMVALFSACGVPVQGAAEPIGANVLPSPLHIPQPAASASDAPSASAVASAATTAAQLRLWFVQDDGLAAAYSSLPAGTSPEVVVAALAIGPTIDQIADGLRTVALDPLTGLALVSVLPADAVASNTGATAIPLESGASGPPGASGTSTPAPESTVAAVPVTVRLSAAFVALPPTEQVLLLGQVVLSVAGSGKNLVSFADEDGIPVAVPLPDGRLLDVPATARDYNSLIIRP